MTRTLRIKDGECEFRFHFCHFYLCHRFTLFVVLVMLGHGQDSRQLEYVSEEEGMR